MKERIKMTPDQLDRAVKLQRQGVAIVRIAEELGVHRNTVGRALAIYNARVYDRLVKRTADEKGRQLAQLEWVIDHALRQWERSTEAAVSVRITTDGAGVPIETVSTTKDQSGDARLLAEAVKALAERRKILGLDRPEPEETEDPLVVAEMMREQYAPEDDA